ncbi:MAG: molecular chaperone DnaJ, partial [Candidatus Ratteibacteria bacterium]
RLRNMGVPKLHGYGKGDMFVKIKVLIPKKLSRHQQSLFQQLKEIENKDEYPEIKNFKEKL